MHRSLNDMKRALCGDEEIFGQIVIDTARTGASVVSHDEDKRYCRYTGSECFIDTNMAGHIRFGDAKAGTFQGRIESLGQESIRGMVSTFGDVFNLTRIPFQARFLHYSLPLRLGRYWLGFANRFTIRLGSR